MIKKRRIVLSAINLFEGGPLSVLNDCLKELIEFKNIEKYEVLILVNNYELINKIVLPSNFTLLAFPLSRKSYIFRLYYEYIYFYFLSKKIEVYLWFSLHDITPNVVAKKRVVYCHNISAFLKPNLRYLRFQPKIYFFSIFYKYLYSINIHKNNYVIVQQDWIKNMFCENYNLPFSNVIVANPQFKNHFLLNNLLKKDLHFQNNFVSFFYPTLPRVFKNIEIICEASKILNKMGICDFNIYITISKKENNYSNYIYNKYNHISNIKFIGRLNREDVFSYYENVDCLLFPSLLESWGLPITEFKSFEKQIIVSDLPFAYETIDKYENAAFFDPNNSFELAKLMKEFILTRNIISDKSNFKYISNENCNTWQKLFNLILEYDV